MHIRAFRDDDLSTLVDLTIEAFRPLFTEAMPALTDPRVFAHDHGSWQDDYREEVPGLHDPSRNRFITVAEDDDAVTILGYVGWYTTEDGSARLEMVAVHPDHREKGVGGALCRAVLADLEDRGVAVVHIGTGGDAFHAPARRLYESLGFTGYPVVDYAKAL